MAVGVALEWAARRGAEAEVTAYRLGRAVWGLLLEQVPALGGIEEVEG